MGAKLQNCQTPFSLVSCCGEPNKWESKRCIIGDLKLKHPSEDWELKPSSIGRAARFDNHPQQLPDIDYTVNKPPAQP